MGHVAQGCHLVRAQARASERRIACVHHQIRLRKRVEMLVAVRNPRAERLDQAAHDRGGCKQADLLEDDGVDAGFPQRRIARRHDAAHAARQSAQPGDARRAAFEWAEIGRDAEHALDERERARLFARRCIERNFQSVVAELAHADDRGPSEPVEGAHVGSVRRQPVDHIGRKPAQDARRQIEPVRNDDGNDRRSGGSRATC